MYLAGVSVRQEDITEALRGTRVSPSIVSDLNKEDLRHDRGVAQPAIRRRAPLRLLGGHREGYREILGISPGTFRREIGRPRNAPAKLCPRIEPHVEEAVPVVQHLPPPDQRISSMTAITRTQNGIDSAHKRLRPSVRGIWAFDDQCRRVCIPSGSPQTGRDMPPAAVVMHSTARTIPFEIVRTRLRYDS
jgi:hypothetical protein